jgi:hypothetical protein
MVPVGLLHTYFFHISIVMAAHLPYQNSTSIYVYHDDAITKQLNSRKFVALLSFIAAQRIQRELVKLQEDPRGLKFMLCSSTK